MTWRFTYQPGLLVAQFGDCGIHVETVQQGRFMRVFYRNLPQWNADPGYREDLVKTIEVRSLPIGLRSLKKIRTDWQTFLCRNPEIEALAMAALV